MAVGYHGVVSLVLRREVCQTGDCSVLPDYDGPRSLKVRSFGITE